MTMHVPARKMDCHTDAATERRWLSFDRNQPVHRTARDPAITCKAFWSSESRRKINGNSCDGCTRIEDSDHAD